MHSHVVLFGVGVVAAIFSLWEGNFDKTCLGSILVYDFADLDWIIAIFLSVPFVSFKFEIKIEYEGFFSP